jgi:hypothetical protein
VRNVDTVDPVLETASDDGRMLDLGGRLVPEHGPATGAPPAMPFAARFQGILIGVLVLGLVLIAQQANKTLYQFGLPLVVVAAFLQIAFGNIPPRSNARTSALLLALTWGLVAALFAFSIWIAPRLIGLGRTGS